MRQTIKLLSKCEKKTQYLTVIWDVYTELLYTCLYKKYLVDNGGHKQGQIADVVAYFKGTFCIYNLWLSEFSSENLLKMPSI